MNEQELLYRWHQVEEMTKHTYLAGWEEEGRRQGDEWG